ncbi:MAG: class II glutamine amidotransferase [Ignavibacteriae bacterium]|nr:class II glutamine amidotransferase [Ignavibacteriota bacterium]
MCRLLFVKSNSQFDIKNHLEIFAEICKTSKEFQGHGWGCSYLENGEWKHYKNINPIWEDDFTKFAQTNRLVVHARSAFEDKDIYIENNMPFYDDTFVFIFNGELRGVKIKADGRIGAEKIFNFIKRFNSDNMKAAIQKGTKIINDRSDYIRAMNFIITDKEKVYVSSLFNVDPDYFQMSYKKTENELIICSQKYPNENEWIKIENKSLMEFK